MTAVVVKEELQDVDAEEARCAGEEKIADAVFIFFQRIKIICIEDTVKYRIVVIGEAVGDLRLVRAFRGDRLRGLEREDIAVGDL